MSSKDSSDQRGSQRDRRSSSSDQPERNAPGGESGARGADAPGTGGSSRSRVRSGNADFGSFVSSSARSSGDLFKIPGSRRGPASSTSTPASSSPSGPERTQTPETRTPEPRADRPRRYWRDAVAQPGESETPGSATSERVQPTSTEGVRGNRIPRRNQGSNAGEGGRIRFMPRDRGDDGGFFSGGTLPSRTLLGILGGALLLLSLLVFALSQGGDDTGDDGNLTPTPTNESVLNPADEPDGTDDDAPSTPGSGATTEAGATEPPSDEAPEPTEDDDQPRPGGDNQLDPQDDPTETPAASFDDPLARKPAQHGFQRT